jgi:tetratricopeptide (TPR) repeat protein
MVRRRRGRKPKARDVTDSGRAGSAGGLGRAEWLALLAVIGLAAILRIAYTFSSRRSPFFDHLDLDSRFYDLWAKDIAAGHWIGKEVFFMGPLYPYFLASIYKIFGTGLVAVKVIQGGLGALTAGLTFLLGRRCFGIPAGLVAGFMAAMYVPFIFYDNSILLPVLATLLDVLMLYLLYVGIRRKRAWIFLAAGLCMGLSAAGNASILVFAVPAAVFLLVYAYDSRGARLRHALFLAVGAAVVVTPITIRNYLVGHDLVLLTSNAGINFYIGNHEQAMGAYVKPEGLDVYTDPTGKTIAEGAVGKELKPSEVSAYWSGRAFQFIEKTPGRFLANLLRKTFFFWSVFEVPQIEHLQFERRYSWLLRIPSPSFGIVCPLGLLGIILSVRRRKEAYLLFLFILTYSMTIIAFFVVARYRLPMIPALLVFAGYTVQWWIGKASRRQLKALVYSAAGFAALFVLVHANFYRIDPRSGFPQSYYRLGLVYEKKGRIPEAIESYRNALKIDPTMGEVYVNLGILLSRQGRYEEAARQLLEAIRQDPKYAKAYYNLGLVYSEEAKNDSALAAIDKALQLKPGYDLALVSKAGILYETARFGPAESLLVYLRGNPNLGRQTLDQIESLLKILPGRKDWMRSRGAAYQRSSDLLLLRGDDLLSLGLTDRALVTYVQAVAADTLSAVALYQAGTLYFNQGDLEKAGRFLRRALRVDPRYVGVHFALGVIAYKLGNFETACREFEQELALDPNSSESHINLAMCYEEHMGDPARAADHLERYIEITGGTPELREHLRKLREEANEKAE